LALVIEEKYDQVRHLISIGRERGYLLYAEVNDILPPELHSSEECPTARARSLRYPSQTGRPSITQGTILMLTERPGIEGTERKNVR
jgi:Sigma-70 factor, region 1.1